MICHGEGLLFHESGKLSRSIREMEQQRARKKETEKRELSGHLCFVGWGDRIFSVKSLMKQCERAKGSLYRSELGEVTGNKDKKWVPAGASPESQ